MAVEPHPPHRSRSRLRRLKDLVVGSVQAFSAHRDSSRAAALAYYTLFSIAPILVLVIVIAGQVFGEAAASGELVAQMRSLVGDDGAELIENIIQASSRSTGGGVASIIATVTLLFSATTAFVELKASLDEAWQVPKQTGSGIVAFLRARLLSLGLVAVLGLFLTVSLAVSAALAAVSGAVGLGAEEAGILLTIANELMSLAVFTGVFAAIYKLLPAVKLRWRDMWLGALVTAVLFTIGKYLIGLYLGHASLTSTFGAAGSLAVLMIWVYYSATIFFLGAEFTRIESQSASGSAGVPTRSEPQRPGASAGANRGTAAPASVSGVASAPERAPVVRRRAVRAIAPGAGRAGDGGGRLLAFGGAITAAFALRAFAATRRNGHRRRLQKLQ